MQTLYDDGGKVREIELSPIEWSEFCALNPEVIEDAGGEAAAKAIAESHGLECGGGAAPLTVVWLEAA